VVASVRSNTSVFHTAKYIRKGSRTFMEDSSLFGDEARDPEAAYKAGMTCISVT